MTSLKNAIAAVAALTLVVPVVAHAGPQDGMVRVQSSINLFFAGPTGEGDEAQKLRDKAQRVVYELAGHQCDLLRDVLAKDCRLESINVNINAVNAANVRQFNPPQVDGVNVSGTMSLQITPK
jgi:hypothetical protein